MERKAGMAAELCQAAIMRAARGMWRVHCLASQSEKGSFMPVIRPSHVFASALLGVFCCTSIAAPAPAPVRAEILALVEKIQTSGCQFERNGKWHGAAEAKAHLLRKFEYAENSRKTIARTEQFIELAASSSSLSGKPYRIKCGSGEPQRSGDWLNRELKALRAVGPRAAP
jgi:hypothetical protein